MESLCQTYGGDPDHKTIIKLPVFLKEEDGGQGNVGPKIPSCSFEDGTGLRKAYNLEEEEEEVNNTSHPSSNVGIRSISDVSRLVRNSSSADVGTPRLYSMTLGQQPPMPNPLGLGLLARYRPMLHFGYITLEKMFR